VSPKAPKASQSQSGATLTRPSAPGTEVEAEIQAPAAPKPPEKRKYKLKIDGQEREEAYSDEEVAVRLQKSLAAEKRMQEAAEVRKKWAQLQEIAKQDPATLFRELVGADPMKWAEQQVAEKWKLEVMPEQERKVYELEQQLKQYQQREQMTQKQKQAEFAKQQEAALEAQLEKDFQAAFQASELPYTPENLEVFGKIALDAHDLGMELTPAQMAAEAKRELSRRESETETKYKGKFTGLKGKELLEYLSEPVVREVLRAAVEKYKPQTSESPVPTKSRTPEYEEPQKPKVYSPSDWRKPFPG
jgi:hypothetical protein